MSARKEEGRPTEAGTPVQRFAGAIRSTPRIEDSWCSPVTRGPWYTDDITTVDFATSERARITEGFDFRPFATPYTVFAAEERGSRMARFLDDLAAHGYVTATLNRVREAEGAQDEDDAPDGITRCAFCGLDVPTSARGACGTCAT